MNPKEKDADQVSIRGGGYVAAGCLLHVGQPLLVA